MQSFYLMVNMISNINDYRVTDIFKLMQESFQMCAYWLAFSNSLI